MTASWNPFRSSSSGRGHPRQRALLINLDFRDAIYSHLWGRAILEACAQRQILVDMVAVNPFAGRDLAVELGVTRKDLDAKLDGAAVYVDSPDEAKCRGAIAGLLDRQHYELIIVNAEAPLFLHLMIDREDRLDQTQWLIYDRHLHLGLPEYLDNERLRERIAAADVHLYTIEEIAARRPSGPVPEIVGTEETVFGSFKKLGFARERVHLQQWPLDDDFFAPRPQAAPRDRFVIFSGGDSGRDYSTLFEAIAGLPVHLRLCARSHPSPIPDNVTILPRLNLHQFRDEVAGATLVVVPLTGDPVVSGITVIAMAKMMGTPVIASDNWVVRLHIPSQGEGGYLTQTRNPALLRLLLAGLIESPQERERLAREGREQARRDLSLRGFANRMLDKK